jgi:hypothetical protein
MAFTSAVLEESKKLGSGEVLRTRPFNVEAFSTFEDGLVQGRFCKFDTGSVDNLDNSSTPKIAGIVTRLIGGEQGVTTYRKTGTIVDTVAEVMTVGFATVTIVTGNTPARYGIAYAVNASGSGADFGKATTTSTNNVDSGYVFWEQVDTNVWLVAKASLV